MTGPSIPGPSSGCFVAWFVFVALVAIGLIGLIVYVVAHFISKFW
jgi:preprotein translocase subunit Sss1